MKRSDTALELFHPLVQRWFMDHVGRPTSLQEQAWPRIATGEHVLITAPTGSGKTLAAFLWAVDRLITGACPMGKTSVLYVSPLKALNNDVQRNLIKPLEELRLIFEEAEEAFPIIRVLTRSGDTPPSERVRMQRRPPEILITTPESLNLLLSSVGGRSILASLSTVILDEIHAVLGSKRGVHLITAVERLVPLSGEFQRIALSATIRPVEKAAEFVGGCRAEGTPHNPRYSPRPVAMVASGARKSYRLRVQFSGTAREGPKENFWQPFVDGAKEIIRKNRSTLLFTNSRRLCEKLTHLINLDEASPLAYAHHGSLSREIRTEVEARLKSGDLKAIVATNSLELGIDIGALDEVVLIQSPPSVSSAVQRIGRAGHQVGQVSRGTLFPIHPRDILEAAVLATGVLDQDIEPVKPVQAPLDVLAQILVSMTGMETWDMDALFQQVRTSYPYRNLSRRHFDLVLNMLAGRYADSRIRELKPRVSIDRMDNTVAAKKGALQTLYFSGGTIPDRGYFHLRHDRTGARIGELDEEFVWEAKAGQIFTLGTQNWKVERITHNDVLVLPADPRETAPPFWRAEETLRDFHLSERIGRFLEFLEAHLQDPGLLSRLEQEYSLDKGAAVELIEFLKRQKDATGCPLPHRHHLLMEFVSTGPGGYPGNQLIIHTVWGGRVNRPFALALEAAWEDRFGRQPEVYVGNDCIAVQLPHPVESEELLLMVRSTTVQSLLKKRLEASGFFGARFRECAGRALLLPRRKMNERMPLWLSRLRSQKLLDSVLPYEDFPILLETWRACLKDEFDLEALIRVLAELESGAIGWTEVHTAGPSPLAQGLTWQQINQYVYMDDQARGGKASGLAGSLLQEVVFSPELRPTVPPEAIHAFEMKLQRLSPGYAPDSPRDLLDWVKERLLLPLTEWEALLAAADQGAGPEELVQAVGDKLVRVSPETAAEPLIAGTETLPRILAALKGGTTRVKAEPLLPGRTVPAAGERTDLLDEEEEDPLAAVLADWLQFYGPQTAAFISRTLGIAPEPLERALEDLVDSEKIVSGELVRGSDDVYICDSENFESLLRIMRSAARPRFEPLDIMELPLFLARFQRITDSLGGIDGLYRGVERLLFYPALSHLWESEILPARLDRYDPSWLDILMQQSDLRWIGSAKNRIFFAFDPELDLREANESEHEKQISAGLFPDPEARYDFFTLVRATGLRPAELSRRLWSAVWRGEAMNDTFAALRRGIETGFKVPEVTSESRSPGTGRRRPGGRTAFSRWKSTVPFLGNWQQVPDPPRQEGLIENEEKRKDRVRLLLERYGVLFRELLQHELPPFRWAGIFRALRLMELSGEVLTGYFFEGIPGPQFVSHEAFRVLRRKGSGEAVYWLCAADPASLCGIRLEVLKGKLPRRVAGTHLVYRGKDLVVVSRGNGRQLTLRVSERDPQLQEYLGFLRNLLTRRVQPMRRILIETINGGKAAQSPYVDALRTSFDVSVDHKNVVLYRSLS